LAVCWTLAAPALATPPCPLYGSRVVDGDKSDWNLALDFYDYMYRAGDPEFPIETYLYLRYDCTTNTVYVLVLHAPDVDIPTIEPKTMWVAIDRHNNKVLDGNSGDDGTPPDFAWVEVEQTPWGEKAAGWEGSFTLMPGTYTIMVHTRVLDPSPETVQTSYTAGSPETGLPMTLDCTVPVERSTWGKVKSLYQ
jgi:hypothetical protein